MTDVGTLTLSDFLLARIAEDEEVARAATPGPWRWATYTPREHYARNALVAAAGTVLLAEASDHEGSYIDASDADATHIARHDPARVLAECEAKRRIVDSWVAAGHAAGAYPGTLAGVEQGLDVALQFLALPYADHPDYREEWRP